MLSSCAVGPTSSLNVTPDYYQEDVICVADWQENPTLPVPDCIHMVINDWTAMVSE